MLENCQNARERWGGVSELIDRWLKERQQLLVHYCELSGESDFSQTDALKQSLFVYVKCWWITCQPGTSRCMNS